MFYIPAPGSVLWAQFDTVCDVLSADNYLNVHLWVFFALANFFRTILDLPILMGIVAVVLQFGEP
ncbi:MAG TPA: hypothetical protein DCG77_07010 [Sphingobacterium sp.]|nr:hypothetical protein [Sphingobacterium sp.]